MRPHVPIDLERFPAMPTIGAVMTPFPFFVAPDDSLARVRRLMAEHGFRHVPVQDAGSIVGIVSDVELRGVVDAKVSAVMVMDPWTVDFHTPLAVVLRGLIERRLGSVLVLHDDDKLAGIFSVSDACRLLAEVLEHRFPSGGDHAA